MRPSGTAVLAGAMLAFVGVASADPLTHLLDAEGGGACFGRVYDDAHLARIPGQQTRRVMLSLVREEPGFDWATVRVLIEGRQRDDVIVGECSWRERANLDTMDQPMLDTFKGGPGLDCHAYASVDGMSAEEGGDFVIDLRDKATVLLHLPDALATWPGLQRDYEADWRDFGVDDRVFRLDRAARAGCSAMEEALQPLE